MSQSPEFKSEHRNLEISLAGWEALAASGGGGEEGSMLPGKLGHRKGVYPLHTSAILPRW